MHTGQFSNYALTLFRWWYSFNFMKLASASEKMPFLPQPKTKMRKPPSGVLFFAFIDQPEGINNGFYISSWILNICFLSKATEILLWNSTQLLIEVEVNVNTSGNLRLVDRRSLPIKPNNHKITNYTAAPLEEKKKSNQIWNQLLCQLQLCKITFCLLSGDESVDLVSTNINSQTGLGTSCLFCGAGNKSAPLVYPGSADWVTCWYLHRKAVEKDGMDPPEGSPTVRMSHRQRKEELIKLWHVGIWWQMWQMCRGDEQDSLSLSLWKGERSSDGVQLCAQPCCHAGRHFIANSIFLLHRPHVSMFCLLEHPELRPGTSSQQPSHCIRCSLHL